MPTQKDFAEAETRTRAKKLQGRKVVIKVRLPDGALDDEPGTILQEFPDEGLMLFAPESRNYVVERLEVKNGKEQWVTSDGGGLQTMLRLVDGAWGNLPSGTSYRY